MHLLIVQVIVLTIVHNYMQFTLLPPSLPPSLPSLPSSLHTLPPFLPTYPPSLPPSLRWTCLQTQSDNEVSSTSEGVNSCVFYHVRTDCAEDQTRKPYQEGEREKEREMRGGERQREVTVPGTSRMPCFSPSMMKSMVISRSGM